METKALKAILKVKSGTTNDLVFHELRRSSIIAKIKDRQHAFFQKVTTLPAGTAIVQNIIDLCEQTSILQYYRNLGTDNAIKDIRDRETKIKESTSSMCKYYVDLGCLDEQCSIYSNYINDYYRYIISRWRLSNHNLRVETDRYIGNNDRNSRVCDTCNVLEDEYHVIFQCPCYATIRNTFPDLVANDDISRFLNPAYEDVKDTASFILGIEELRGDYE